MHGTHEESKPSVVKASRGLIIAIVFGVAASLVAAGFGWQASQSSSDLVTKDDVAGCKSLYRVPFDDAFAALVVVLSDAVTDDRAQFVEAVAAKPAATDELERTSDAYFDAIERSVDDPAAFVAQCKLDARD